MCLFPKLIKNRKYTANKKNGGVIPAVSDPRVLSVAVGCGNCLECRKQKAREWQVRMLEDIKTNTNGKFITLTFSDESISKLCIYIRDKSSDPFCIPEGYELDNLTAITGIRLFMERWRKKFKKSVRHWLVTELGHEGTQNIHLHGILWTNESKETIDSIWQYGYTWIGDYVNGKTVNYIIKYVNKIDEKHPNYKSRILSSAGIGSNYIKTGDWKRNKYKGESTNEGYKTSSGHTTNMPIYWRNKIYSDEEREKLWLLKLNKQERYILGNKVDISNGLEEYTKGIEYAREYNKRLGYGNNEIDYNQREYEKQQRILMQQTRMMKANNNNKNKNT